MNDNDRRYWEWLHPKWKPIAYRTKWVIMNVLRGQRWHPWGDGKDLRFERLIETRDGEWPFDREVVEVRFSDRGHLVSWSRHKVIQIDRGRSHAGLCKALGVEDVQS